MANALVLSDGSGTDRAARWAELPADELKRRAVTAARDRDVDQLWSLAEAWLTLHGRTGAKLSRHTVDAYRHAVTCLVTGFGAENLLHPRRDAGHVWVRELEEADLAASTIQVRISGARLLYKALRWANATNADPLQDVRTAPDATPAWSKRSPYSKTDVARLLKAADPDDTALILLCAHTGCRASEAMAVTWEDVDLERRRLTVQHGKGGKRRVIVMSATLCSHLDSLPRTGAYLLPYRSDENARHRLRGLCRATGVKYRGLHAFRHFAGTELYRQTGKLEAAQHHLGHSNISTTQIYAHFADETLEDSVGNW